MVTNNASFNCNAAKMLITAEGLAAARRASQQAARPSWRPCRPRKAYYPGAFAALRGATPGTNACEKIGTAGEDDAAVDARLSASTAENQDERLFSTEPFCSILSEISLDSDDPAEFLAAGDRVRQRPPLGHAERDAHCPPEVEATREVAAALDDALRDLRYGTVAINHWPALGYALVTTPWGGHPSATLENIQSGLGWVHNTFMLEGIEKCVLRGPSSRCRSRSASCRTRRSTRWGASWSTSRPRRAGSRCPGSPWPR